MHFILDFDDNTLIILLEYILFSLNYIKYPFPLKIGFANSIEIYNILIIIVIVKFNNDFFMNFYFFVLKCKIFGFYVYFLKNKKMNLH